MEGKVSIVEDKPQANRLKQQIQMEGSTDGLFVFSFSHQCVVIGFKLTNKKKTFMWRCIIKDLKP